VLIGRKAAEVAEAEEEEEEGEVAELSSMFKVGQPLIVAVVSCIQVPLPHTSLHSKAYHF